MNEPIYNHLSVEDLQQNELDLSRFMSAQGAGRELLDEHEYFGNAFYDEDNHLFI